jgi:hypothetical protein
MRKTVALGIVLLACCGTAAVAATSDRKNDVEAPQEQPTVMIKLLECKSLTDPAARLACYDQQVSALDTARQNGDIVIADKEQVRKARRGLFGFAAPLGKIFGMGGNNADKADDDNRLETTVAAVRRSRDGTLKLEFAEGGTWEQTDRSGFPLTPRVGNKAVITRGALGAYFISVDGMAGIKFRRVE